MIGNVPPGGVRHTFCPDKYYVVVHRMFALDEAPVWRPVYSGRGIFRRTEFFTSVAGADAAFRDAIETYGAERVAIARMVPKGIEIVAQLPAVSAQQSAISGGSQ